MSKQENQTSVRLMPNGKTDSKMLLLAEKKKKQNQMPRVAGARNQLSIGINTQKKMVMVCQCEIVVRTVETVITLAERGLPVNNR